MPETKAFWRSKGFWGPITAFVAFAAQQAGLGTIDEGKLLETILYLAEVGGMLWGLYGRAKATAPLGMADRPKPLDAVRAAWPATVIAVLLALVLVGCAAATLAPQTARERLVAAEADYSAAVATIGELTDRGLIRGTDAERAGRAIIAARSALDAWHLSPDASDKMTLGLGALRALQELVRSFQPGQAVTAPDPPATVALRPIPLSL